MSEQTHQSSPNPSSPDPQTSITPPANSGAPQQIPSSPPLPISSFTGQPYDPAWGIPLQKGAGNEQIIQQIMKPEIERKILPPENETKK